MKHLLAFVSRGYLLGDTTSQVFNEGIFYTNRRRANINNWCQFLSPEHSQLRFLDAGLRDSSGQPVDLLVCSLNVFVMGIGCSLNFLSCPHSSRPEGCSYIWSVVINLKFISVLQLQPRFQGKRQGKGNFCSQFCQVMTVDEEIETLIWKVVTRIAEKKLGRIENPQMKEGDDPKFWRKTLSMWDFWTLNLTSEWITSIRAFIPFLLSWSPSPECSLHLLLGG